MSLVNVTSAPGRDCAAVAATIRAAAVSAPEYVRMFGRPARAIRPSSDGPVYTPGARQAATFFARMRRHRPARSSEVMNFTPAYGRLQAPRIVPRYRFSGFTVSPTERLLLRNGEELPLIPRYF